MHTIASQENIVTLVHFLPSAAKFAYKGDLGALVYTMDNIYGMLWGGPEITLPSTYAQNKANHIKLKRFLSDAVIWPSRSGLTEGLADGQGDSTSLPLYQKPYPRTSHADEQVKCSGQTCHDRPASSFLIPVFAPQISTPGVSNACSELHIFASARTPFIGSSTSPRSRYPKYSGQQKPSVFAEHPRQQRRVSGTAEEYSVALWKVQTETVRSASTTIPFAVTESGNANPQCQEPECAASTNERRWLMIDIDKNEIVPNCICCRATLDICLNRWLDSRWCVLTQLPPAIPAKPQRKMARLSLSQVIDTIKAHSPTQTYFPLTHHS
ncbi:hypothetical protein GE09DRAFT_1236687 [Coniochaeta sp. 2T2.1]|nr:hypothetical protein GE09DRAFT_1236687 [Coniochaeta sp. 2T2.1]